VDNIQRQTIEALGAGPKTQWWIGAQLGISPHAAYQSIHLLQLAGFVEERGVEYLYPQTDRRDGVRRKRGDRLKTWTAIRTYYALTPVGRVLLPLSQIKTGAV
jgi:hypothetical protein